MIWLTVLFAVETAWLPNGVDVFSTPPTIAETGGRYLIAFESVVAALDVISIGGRMHVDTRRYIEQFGMNAAALQSTVFARVEWQGLSLTATHYCGHPLTPYASHSGVQPLRDIAYQEVAIRYETEVAWPGSNRR